MFRISAARAHRMRTRRWRALIICAKINVVKINPYDFLWFLFEKNFLILTKNSEVLTIILVSFGGSFWHQIGSFWSWNLFLEDFEKIFIFIFLWMEFRIWLQFDLQNSPYFSLFSSSNFFVFSFFSNIFKSTPTVLIFDEGLIDIISKLLMYKTFS